nr:hypothetical protein GCM10025730_22290 [Promicromonospora thailandica]
MEHLEIDQRLGGDSRQRLGLGVLQPSAHTALGNPSQFLRTDCPMNHRFDTQAVRTTRLYIMSWGTLDHGAIRMPVNGVDEFRRAYDLAEADADIAGSVFEIDLWDIDLPTDRPLMVQFLVGHPTHSRVLVHQDGLALYAANEVLTDGSDVRYERPGGTFTAEPQYTRVTPTQAREIAADFVRTGRASGRIAWAEQSMD